MILTLLAFEISPNLNTLLIGLLVPILGVLSPILISRQINKNTLAVKKQEWDRQDQLAARARKDVTTTHKQLEKIHALVNSEMTETIRNELEAIQETVKLMGELILVNRQNGIEPNLEILASLKGREQKIKELEDVLEIREKKDAQSKLEG